MSLVQQETAFQDAVLKVRMHAAIRRHAVFLVTKVSPTNAEIAWRDAVLGLQYDDVSFLGRNRAFMCARSTVYDAADLTDTTVTDAILLAIVTDLPQAIKP